MRQIPQLLARILARLAFLGRSRTAHGLGHATPAPGADSGKNLKDRDPVIPSPLGGPIVAGLICLHHGVPGGPFHLLGSGARPSESARDGGREDLPPIRKGDLRGLDMDDLIYRLLEDQSRAEPESRPESQQ
jgi:hypothetical protein